MLMKRGETKQLPSDIVIVQYLSKFDNRIPNTFWYTSNDTIDRNMNASNGWMMQNVILYLGLIIPILFQCFIIRLDCNVLCMYLILPKDLNMTNV